MGAVLTDIIMALHHGFHEVSVTAWRVVDGGSLSRKYISDEMPCCFNERHGAPERPPPPSLLKLRSVSKFVSLVTASEVLLGAQEAARD